MSRNKVPPGVRRAPGGRPGWQVRYRGGDGVQRTRTVDTLDDARRFLAEVTTEVQRGDWISPDAGRVLFGEYAEHVESHRRGRREITRERDLGILRHRLIPRFGSLPIGRIRRLDVQEWISEMVEAGLGPDAVRKSYQLAARIFDAAVEDRIIPATPCRNVSLPAIVRPRRFALEPQHVTAIADAVPDRYRTLVLLAAATGLRWGELAGLRGERVDLLRRELSIEETLVELSDGRIEFGLPKTAKSRGRVSFPAELGDLLAAHVEHFVRRDDRGRVDRHALVFTSPEGAPLRRSNFRRKVWLPALTAAGVPAEVHFHDLRHFTASLLIDRGLTVLEVSEKLRHARPSVTLDVYAHRFSNATERADSAIGAALFG